MVSQMERILVLAKTYPSPSARHVETSCVAGITEQGSMRRLYPVPFRLIGDAGKFAKWQWIEVLTEKARKDHRPESYKIYIDQIKTREKIDAKPRWNSRWPWIEKIPSFINLDGVQKEQADNGLSLALLKPKAVCSLEITKARHEDWTAEEKEKLLSYETQGRLFDSEEVKKITHTLRKIPFDFYYHYLCDTPEGEKSFKHKIVDWEAGALYWQCRQLYGPNWDAPFREKLERQLPQRNLMFLMGNQHRFQDQWLIISLIYPPTRAPVPEMQGSLF